VFGRRDGVYDHGDAAIQPACVDGRAGLNITRSFSHRESLLLIILVSLLTFGNSLFNDFVGDDHMVVVHNTFYETWTNFPKLFTRDYITSPDEALNRRHYAHTGSVAYRPVLSMTFFADYWLWQRSPFGYHLQNLLWHIANALLAYGLFLSILGNPALAVFSALLFAVHPLKTEAVCAIGYRADVLACFFFLTAFLTYLKAENLRGLSRRLVMGGSCVSLFLALFSKESAIVFIGILAAYRWIIRGERIRDIFKRFLSRDAGFFLITFFYLYVYIFVFRNATLSAVHFLGGDIRSHGMIVLKIFAEYVQGFILPFMVKILPPGYFPSGGTGHGDYQAWFSAGVLFLLVCLFIRLRRRERGAAFLLAWFLMSYIPVSNLIPIATPMGQRFMYLPSIGFLGVLAILIHMAGVYWNSRGRDVRWGAWLPKVVILACMAVTVPLNMAWKDNFMMALHMVRDYPSSPIGHMHLGIEYYRRGDVEKAYAALQNSLERGMDDPRGFFHLGLCHFNDFERSRSFYEESIRRFPYYALPYTGVGRGYVLSQDYARALPYLENSVRLTSLYTGYGYLIQAYMGLGRREDAEAVYGAAKMFLTKKSYLDSLQKLILEWENFENPVDIGI
jgi:hypothetical protein